MQHGCFLQSNAVDDAPPSIVIRAAPFSLPRIHRTQRGYLDVASLTASGCAAASIRACNSASCCASAAISAACFSSSAMRVVCFVVSAACAAICAACFLVMAQLGCGGVAVFPGDIIAADHDGAVVIPRHLAAEVARDGVEQERLERFVRRRVDRGASIVGLYPPNEAALAHYRRWVDAGESDDALADR